MVVNRLSFQKSVYFSANFLSVYLSAIFLYCRFDFVEYFCYLKVFLSFMVLQKWVIVMVQGQYIHVGWIDNFLYVDLFVYIILLNIVRHCEGKKIKGSNFNLFINLIVLVIMTTYISPYLLWFIQWRMSVDGKSSQSLLGPVSKKKKPTFILEK